MEELFARRVGRFRPQQDCPGCSFSRISRFSRFTLTAVFGFIRHASNTRTKLSALRGVRSADIPVGVI